MIRSIRGLLPVEFALLLFVAGCGANTNTTQVLRLATTTSARDSGLLDELLPQFERATDCRVNVIAVGSGAALKLGEAGDVDVVLVHSRMAEEAFISAGHGIRHEEFMENDFVLLGPPGDPAGVRNVSPVDAFAMIAKTRSRFVSRGDKSGTHQREQALWQAAGGRSDWPQYLESGHPMGMTIVIADEKSAYTLSDLGTYLKFRDKIDLRPLNAPSEKMRNPYAAIVVDPSKHARVNAALAGKLVDFLIAAETQRLVAEYRVAGEALFRPTRLKANRP